VLTSWRQAVLAPMFGADVLMLRGFGAEKFWLGRFALTRFCALVISTESQHISYKLDAIMFPCEVVEVTGTGVHITDEPYLL